MNFVTPNYDESTLAEFNHCHDPKTGRFCTGEGAGSGGSADYKRPHVIQTSSLDYAIQLIQQGKTVELPDTRAAYTLLDKLAKIANDAAAKGVDAPYYNLCHVSVKNTNLFCADKVKTAEFPKGITRLQMPQFTGAPRTGSPADALPRDKDGFVDAAPDFLAYLQDLGVKTTREQAPAAKLRATQAELNGAKVAEMMTRANFDPHRGVIFVSRDHYVIDGHHRWAAVVGLDARDNALGDITMNVIRVDAPISEVLHIARRFTQTFGIEGRAAAAIPHRRQLPTTAERRLLKTA